METAVLEEKHHNNKKCAELEEVVSRLQVDIDKIGTVILSVKTGVHYSILIRTTSSTAAEVGK